MRSLETKIPPVALTALLGFVAWLLAILIPGAQVAIPARTLATAFLVLKCSKSVNKNVVKVTLTRKASQSADELSL